jgi:hypothetical protein
LNIPFELWAELDACPCGKTFVVVNMTVSVGDCNDARWYDGKGITGGDKSGAPPLDESCEMDPGRLAGGTCIWPFQTSLLAHKVEGTVDIVPDGKTAPAPPYMSFDGSMVCEATWIGGGGSERYEGCPVGFCGSGGMKDVVWEAGDNR